MLSEQFRLTFPRRHRPQPELPWTFLRPRHQLRFVRHGIGPVMADWLKQAQEDGGRC